jgi:HSP20 family protein
MPEARTAVQRVEQPSAIRTTRRESLLDTMNKTFDDIARQAFEMLESNGRTFGRDLEDWLKAEGELLHPVHMTLAEAGDTLEVKAEVPGFSEKELEISVEPRRLTIAGKRESEKEEKKGEIVSASTCCSDQLLRIVDLPTEIETDKVTATLKNGVLNLTMPKVAKARSIKIQPKTA